GFVALEVAAGIWAQSVALLADAGHNLSDVLGLVLAWGAARLSAVGPNERRTYGLRRTSILAALTNALLLLVATGGITWEALRRFVEPAPVAGSTIMIVAAIGAAINGATALLFLSGRHRDLNLRGAFLHMSADAAISLAVVVCGALIRWKGWTWVDPVASLAIVAAILVSTF